MQSEDSSRGLAREPGRFSHTEWAVRRLRTAITSGEIEPNAPLRANELAERWGISATPIREAFQRLAADGFLVYSSHRGVRVAPMSAEELDELVDLRAAVEPLALRRSLERADDRWRDELRLAWDLLRAAYEQRPFDRASYEVCHGDFHAQLSAGAGPTWWPRISVLLRDQAARYRAVDVEHRELELVMAEHDSMAEACLAGDIDSAVATLQRHIAASKQALQAHLRNRAQIDG
jgi:GntR family carbon starvation induced transcriptional regulator